MKYLRIKTVNKAISDRGIDAELIDGGNYFYFIGPDVELAYSTSVPVFNLNDLSLEMWMNLLDDIIEKGSL